MGRDMSDQMGFDEAFERAKILDLLDQDRKRVAQILTLERLRVERGREIWELEVEAAVPAEGGFAVRLAGIARRIE